MSLPLFYLESAAARWFSFKGRTPPSGAKQSVSSPPPYNPSYSAAHASYIQIAHERWISRPRPVQKAVPMVTGRVVGRGEAPPAAGSWQQARRQRWQDRHDIWRNVWEAKIDAERTEKEAVMRACGVPRDVREMWKLRKELATPVSHEARGGTDCGPDSGVDSLRRLAFGGGCVGECPRKRKIAEAILAVESRAGRSGCVGSVCGFKRGLEKAPALEVAGASEADTYELVLARYSGRPDELYRRRTARKWAVWRRSSAAREAREARAVEDAERNMKRRRGADFLGSQRAEGEKGFAPFLWDTGMNCYVYSSKIAGKKELREGMMRKYSIPDEDTTGEALKPRQKAHEMAEKTELFHTKVMNRFV